MEKIFNNTQVAFALKSDTELDRAYFLFKMIASEPLVRIGTAVTNFALKAHLPVEGLIRASVFDHFCGGVNEEDCLSVVDKMYTKGKVSSVLDYSVEGKEAEDQFDFALDMTLKTIEFAKERQAIYDVNNVKAFMALTKFSPFTSLRNAFQGFLGTTTRGNLKAGFSGLVKSLDPVMKKHAYEAGVMADNLEGIFKDTIGANNNNFLGNSCKYQLTMHPHHSP